MSNAQLKPGYNVQFAVNSEFITGIGVFSNRTDYATFEPMLENTGRNIVESWPTLDMKVWSITAICTQMGRWRLSSPIGTKKKRMYKQQIGRADNMAYCAETD